MRPIPQALGEQIDFFESCVARWTAGAAPGVSSAQVMELAALVAETVRARVAAEQAKESAKATTRTLHTARAAMLALGRAMVSTERLGAEAPAAQIEVKPSLPAAAAPGPALESPSIPTNIRLWTSNQGDVTIAWDAERAGAPTGVYFEVRRAIVEGPGSGPDSIRTLTTADTRYVDAADLAANPSPPPLDGGVLAYQLRAIRGSGPNIRTSAWTSLYVAGRRPAPAVKAA